jgi:hypothetical protein
MPDAVDEAAGGFEYEAEVMRHTRTDLETEEVPAIETVGVQEPFLEARVVPEPLDQDAPGHVPPAIDGVFRQVDSVADASLDENARRQIDAVGSDAADPGVGNKRRGQPCVSDLADAAAQFVSERRDVHFLPAPASAISTAFRVRFRRTDRCPPQLMTFENLSSQVENLPSQPGTISADPST